MTETASGGPTDSEKDKAPGGLGQNPQRHVVSGHGPKSIHPATAAWLDGATTGLTESAEYHGSHLCSDRTPND